MPRQLLGTAIAANTITTTQLQTTIVNNITQGGGPRVSSLVYPDNDTAANTAGGQTIYVVGSGFATNAAVYINGNAVPSISFISSSNLQITTPALSSATYPLYVINPENGATAIHIPGLIVSGEPTWVTSAGSLNASQDELSSWSYSLSATGDAPITYALAAGSSLPTGVSLASNGTISGTISSPTGNVTTYTFSVVATDAQNQDSTRQFTVTTSTGEGVLFANNVLLIHADGTNNGNNHHFLDSSNNNFTITRSGNATQGSFSPFSQTGWSNLFDGVDDNLSVSAGSGSWADFGSGEFTIEAWIFPRTVSTLQGICGTHTGGTNTWQFRLNNATLEIFGGGSGGTAYAGGSVAANTWTHVAVCRSGTNVYVFVNGTLTTRSVGSSDTFPASTNVTIGNLYSSPSAYWFNGYISNLRVLKGTALYTSTFTVPTSPLAAVSNTQLLTCQSNRYFDASSGTRAITVAGAPSVQPFSPFAPTAAYSTANVGGSAYFDGSGDYLSIADDVALDAFTDFTIEGWVYFNSAADSQAIVTKGWDASSTFSPYILYTSSGGLVFTASTDGSSWGVLNASVIPNITVGRWYHFAVARSGSTIRYFNNGALTGTSTLSAALMNSTYALTIGSHRTGGYYLNGYLSGLRIVKGTAVYTSAFTPPTTPLTAVANTSLLCNFTNAQIFDQTAKNVIETVGDAKVSTAQYKYGTGSMYFDGTGDWLLTRTSPNLDMGTGDLTIEGWFYLTATVAVDYRMIVSDATNGNNYVCIRGGGTGGQLEINVSGVSFRLNLNNTVVINTWFHLAVTRYNGTWYAFVNGISLGTSASASAFNLGNGGMYIGRFGGATAYEWPGYIDDLRITKGYARYTSNFTPPTSAFKDK